jgi:hypothetical protein
VSSSVVAGNLNNGAVVMNVVGLLIVVTVT